MTRGQLKAKDGFTILEAFLAAMALAIYLGAFILSFSMAMQMVSTASNQMTAVHTARDALESLRTNSFTSIVLAAGSHTFTNANSYFTAP